MSDQHQNMNSLEKVSFAELNSCKLDVNKTSYINFPEPDYLVNESFESEVFVTRYLSNQDENIDVRNIGETDRDCHRSVGFEEYDKGKFRSKTIIERENFGEENIAYEPDIDYNDIESKSFDDISPSVKQPKFRSHTLTNGCNVLKLTRFNTIRPMRVKGFPKRKQFVFFGTSEEHDEITHKDLKYARQVTKIYRC